MSNNIIVSTGDIKQDYEIIGPVYFSVSNKGLFGSQLGNLIKKYKGEKFLFPCSNIRTEDIPEYLSNNEFNFTEAAFYRTVASDLSDLENVFYDILVFFSPFNQFFHSVFIAYVCI